MFWVLLGLNPTVGEPEGFVTTVQAPVTFRPTGAVAPKVAVVCPAGTQISVPALASSVPNCEEVVVTVKSKELAQPTPPVCPGLVTVHCKV